MRKARGVAQQDLSAVTARSYLSYVERGVKKPSVEKLDELARAIGVHPLTVLTIAYLNHLTEQELQALLRRVEAEARIVLKSADLLRPRKSRR